ncbi:MAG TPA: DUF4038 domain-containing protein [Steroidobacteraceae bacterium]
MRSRTSAALFGILFLLALATPSYAQTTWSGSDIGAVAAPGSYSVSGNSFTVRASGADIWNKADEFYYVYRTLAGDGEITAQVASVSNTNEWTKAGVMLRESLNANSRFALMCVTPGKGAAFHYRLTTGAGAAPNNSGDLTTKAPYWVRVKRQGTTVSGYLSADGANWTLRKTITLTNLAATVYIGLALTSHLDGTIATAVLQDPVVTTAGGGGGTSPDTSPPSQPQNLNAAPTSSAISLNWNASTDSGGSGLAGYHIFRNGGSTPLATASGTSYSDTSVAPNTSYTYATTAVDNAGNESMPSNVASATSSGGSSSVFPLHAEAGKRYPVDASGNPFFMVADTAWTLPQRLQKSAASTYLNDRKQRGFNALLMELIEHKVSSPLTANAYGDKPFLATIAGSSCPSGPCWDFSKPNEAYWAHVDWLLDEVERLGFLAVVTPSYVGYQGSSQGWYKDTVANGTTVMRNYGRFLGNRYKNHQNILWVEAGDYNVPNRDIVRAVANGINDVIPGSLQTAHNARGMGALEYWPSESWLNVNTIYTTDSTVVSEANTAWGLSSMPFFLVEAKYEGEGASERTVRAQAYQAVLSGAFGQFLGNSPLWRYDSGWQTAMNGIGSRSMTQLASAFTSRAWWKLVPDTGHTLLKSGYGSGNYQSVAGLATDRSFAMLYLATLSTASIDMSKLAGPRVTATWRDPTNGAQSAVAGSPFTASAGVRSIVPPGNNGTGNTDWVLILTSTQ